MANGRMTRWLLILWLLVGFSLPALALQDQEIPSLEDIGAKLEALNASEIEGKDALIATYLEAQAALKRAAKERQTIKSMEAAKAEAGPLLLVVQKELSQAPQEPSNQDAAQFSLVETEAQFQRVQAELLASRGSLDELTAEGKQRLATTALLANELAAEQQLLATQVEALAATSLDPESEPRRQLLLCQMEAHSARIQAIIAEEANYEARRELLPKRVEREQRRVALLEKELALWRKHLEAKRAAAGEAAAREAQQQLQEIMDSFPELKELAERNHELASLRSGDTGLPARLSKAQLEFDRTRARYDETKSRYDAARRRIKVGGLTETMGIILRRDKELLPEEATLRAESKSREQRLSATLLEHISIEEEKDSVGDLSLARQQLLAKLKLDPVPDNLSESAYGLLVARREAQISALKGLQELIDVFDEHKGATEELSKIVSEYRAFIEKRILWVQNTGTNPLPSALGLPLHLGKLLQAAYELRPLEGMLAAASEQPQACFLISLLLLLLVLGRGYLIAQRTEMGLMVRSYKTDKYSLTLRAVLQTLLLALFFPLCTWSLGWLLAGSTVDLEHGFGLALMDVAWIWLVLRFLRGVLATKGVGQSHFKLPANSIALVRKELRWFEPLAVTFSFVVLALDRQSHAEWSDSIGRSAFILLMLALTRVSSSLFGAESELWSIWPKSGKGFFGKTHAFWTLLSTGIPLLLALLALGGYYYTALQFEQRFLLSIGFALLLMLINAMLLRWLFMTRRRLAVGQALEARAKREADEAGEELSGDHGSATVDDDKIDIPEADARTRELFKSGVTLATFVGLYFIWASVLPALRGLDRIQLLPTVALISSDEELREESLEALVPTAEQVAEADPASIMGVAMRQPEVQTEPGTNGLGLPAQLTLADVLLAIVFLILTLVAAKNLPALLELAILQRLPFDSGERYALSTLTRYVILLIGLSAVSGALGIGWQKLQWLVAALTFGLAFGLQEIFANFVSGLIILIERPVRVGDIVTVGGTEGRVAQLRMRATTVLDFDRREILIPNKEFITGNVINWTLSDPITRLIIKVGVAYGSDVALTRRLLMRTARQCPLVLDDPAPEPIFRRFGDSSLDFELRIFIPHRDLWPVVFDQMHSAIDAAFRQAGIEIAFPQRDIHIRSRPEDSVAPAKVQPDEIR